MKIGNVLSLFDGMSCGQIALNRAGIEYNNYFSSEIDKYAINVTKANYPDTHHLGDITGIIGVALPKIDLLIGGSPCQGFSFAGKQLNFEDPRSKLFFEYVRLLKETKPKYFLLENVKMKKEYQDIISGYLGVEPIEINSSLVSAQNRKRLYWTNIPYVGHPEDKGMLLEDIIQDGVATIPKSMTLIESYHKKNICDWEKKRNGGTMVHIGNADIKGNDMIKRVYHVSGKSPTLTAVCGGHQEKKIALNKSEWRKLTPVECERLQTVPDDYTNHASNTQRYKMLGNGWTIDVISHIFNGIKLDEGYGNT